MEFLGKGFLLLILLSPLIWLLATDKKRSAARKADLDERQARAPVMHCMTCGSEFQLPGAGALRGSTVIELVLWLTVGWLAVGLIYSIWRRMGVGKAKLACPKCASNSVIPADSPAAGAHRRQLEQ